MHIIKYRYQEDISFDCLQKKKLSSILAGKITLLLLFMIANIRAQKEEFTVKNAKFLFVRKKIIF